MVAIPEITNNKPKPLDKTEEEKADEADSNARLAEAMKLQAEMQEAKLQALKVANKSRQTAAIQVRKTLSEVGFEPTPPMETRNLVDTYQVQAVCLSLAP